MFSKCVAQFYTINTNGRILVYAHAYQSTLFCVTWITVSFVSVKPSSWSQTKEIKVVFFFSPSLSRYQYSLGIVNC